MARHNGLEYAVLEYEKAEFPGSHDMATFYVTNLREPVARSVSAFNCKTRHFEICCQVDYLLSILLSFLQTKAVGTVTS